MYFVLKSIKYPIFALFLRFIRFFLPNKHKNEGVS